MCKKEGVRVILGKFIDMLKNKEVLLKLECVIQYENIILDW